MTNFSTHLLETAMRAAFRQAELAAKAGEFPYGAVVIDKAGAIVARAQDQVTRGNDPTQHAEIAAVRAAIRAVGPDLTGHALVSNVEPCAMCATAAWWARVDCVAYGLSQADLFAIRPESMDEPGLTLAQTFAPFMRKVEIRGDILHPAAQQLWVSG